MMGNTSVDTIEPSCGISLKFQTKVEYLLLLNDATDGVHSLSTSKINIQMINTLFDGAILSAKGSRLMHTCFAWLEEMLILLGLHAYFEKHQYSKTPLGDLWDALGQASKGVMSPFMDSWLEHSRVPVLTVKELKNVL